MGDTLHILSCFTTHSSDCLFTSRYVRCLYVCVISAFLCVLVSMFICIFCIFYPVEQRISGLCMCARVFFHVCGCLLAASYSTSCLFSGPQRAIRFSIRLSQSQNRRRFIVGRLCLASYPLLLDEEDQKLLTHETWL